SRLTPPQRGRAAVSAEKNPGEDDLEVPRGDEPAGLLDGVVHRLAPERRPQPRDDAVGAVRVAAVLDLEEGALPSGLVLAEERQRGGPDAARNLIDICGRI